jgi:phosphohistidine swiveling domain-containing protein
VGLVGVPEISADPLCSSWVDDLRLALAQLQRHRSSMPWDEIQVATQAEAFRSLLATCTWPEEGLLWRLLLPLLRQYLGICQDLPFYLATVQPLLRQVLLALARHLPLEQPEAVFYLTQAELRHLLQTPLNAYKIDELHELVQARQLEQQIISRINHPHQSSLVPLDLQGLPAHGGRYFGRLRVVRTTPDLETLRHGDVMVTDYFEPHWEPAFAKIAGLITELGGVTSHGGRLARQYHVPAVTGVPQACQRLTTGQVVNLNGFTGQVQAYQPEVLAALRRA